jgi:hypothetical protein
MLRRKGKDKAKEHFQKTGKYDGKATRRVIAYYEKIHAQKSHLESGALAK